jgi:hypothetical protein
LLWQCPGLVFEVNLARILMLLDTLEAPGAIATRCFHSLICCPGHAPLTPQTMLAKPEDRGIQSEVLCYHKGHVPETLNTHGNVRHARRELRGRQSALFGTSARSAIAETTGNCKPSQSPGHNLRYPVFAKTRV